MNRFKLVSRALCALLYFSRVALAEDPRGQGPVEQGTFVVGAEHLTGIVHTDLKGGGDTVGITVVSFLAYEPTTIYDVPRLAFDGFVADGFSIGGAAAVYDASVGQSGQTSVSVTDVLLEPRFGYAYMFSETVGIWPKAGVSYWHRGISEGGPSSHAFAVDLECPLVLVPVRHFAITVGPIFDITFAGSAGGAGLGDLGASTTEDIKVTQFGVSAGVAGIF